MIILLSKYRYFRNNLFPSSLQGCIHDSLVGRTANVLNSPLENTDEHLATPKITFSSNCWSRLPGTWLTGKRCRRIDERKELRLLLLDTNEDERNVLNIYWRKELREVQRTAHHDQKNFTIALMKEETTANNTNFTSIPNQLADGWKHSYKVCSPSVT